MVQIRKLMFSLMAFAMMFGFTTLSSSNSGCWAASFPMESEDSASAKDSVSAKAEEEHGHGPDLKEISHNFASEGQQDPMSISGDLSFWTAIVFLMLCFGLYVSAWKPIKQGLEAREAGIAKQIEDAKRASEEAKVKLAEYQAKLDEAARQSQEMLAQARKDAEAAGQRMLADASAEAGRLKDRAIADIETAKSVALSELGQKSADIAFSLARGIVGRELKQADHQQLIQEALRSVPSKN